MSDESNYGSAETREAAIRWECDLARWAKRNSRPQSAAAALRRANTHLLSPGADLGLYALLLRTGIYVFGSEGTTNILELLRSWNLPQRDWLTMRDGSIAGTDSPVYAEICNQVNVGSQSSGTKCEARVRCSD
jgi:hypothetical protein